MSQDAKNTIPSFLSSIGDLDADIADEIEAARHAFQEAYEANAAEIPREQFLSDLEKLDQAFDLLKSASSVTDKHTVLTKHYIPLVKELAQRYSDFLPDEVSRKLIAPVMIRVAMFQLLEAVNMMVSAMEDEQEPRDQAGMLYTALIKMSETLEKYIKYLSVRLREQLRAIANMHLSDPDPAFNPDSYPSDPTAYSYMIGLKNTARSILWQLDNYQEETKYTVKGLLDWAETRPGWAGDDFEECLDYVNRARKG
ncbi:MAG: hypothetical protein KME43_21375 [Myxacorys chilensis ATA2-1-KO14]|jgi:hypothetical protein|nr:hypothetical protein [Myxacorys chilensis ATA2-1-KO14]